MKDLVSEGFANVVKPYIDNEIATRAKLGAHNFFTTKNTGGRGPYTSWTTEAKGIRLSNSQSSTYCYQQFIQNLQKNTDYTISADITVASGSAGLVIKGDATNILTQLNISGSVKYTFNTGNYDTITITFYCATDTAAVGNVLYDNLLVKLATDKDETPQPYAKTNQELTAENQTLTNNLSDEVSARAKLGAHQLMPLDLAVMKGRNTSGTWNGNSYTRDGITYTVELDNYGNVIGFDVDGTGHGAPFVICPSAQIARLLNLPLIMSCNTSPDLSFMAYQYDGTSNLSCNGDDVNVTFTSNNAQLQFYISSSSDKTFSHFKIYPLLRTEDDPSREFTPYAMTNRELTEDVNNLIIPISLTVDSVSISGNSVADIKLNDSTSINVSDKIPSGYKLGAVIFTWSTAHSCVPTQCYVSSNNNYRSFALSLYNISSGNITVSSIDVVLICKRA